METNINNRKHQFQKNNNFANATHSFKRCCKILVVIVTERVKNEKCDDILVSLLISGVKSCICNIHRLLLKYFFFPLTLLFGLSMMMALMFFYFFVVVVHLLLILIHIGWWQFGSRMIFLAYGCFAWFRLWVTTRWRIQARSLRFSWTLWMVRQFRWMFTNTIQYGASSMK